MQNRFGVAVRFEFVAFGNQFVAVIGMIIYFAVVDYDARFVRAEHRLRAVCNVNDRKPPMSETDIFVDKNASVVRSAMRYHVAHRTKNAFVNLPF